VDGVAIYAAVVGTGSLGWQVFRERRRLRTIVRVEFEHASRPIRSPNAAIGPGEPLLSLLDYELAVVVINDGETAEWVRSISIEDAAGTHGYDFGHPSGGDQELQPRARTFARLTATDLPFDPANGFYGIVHLASGSEVRSKLSHLDDGILEHIAERNGSVGFS
jgi:hypothetical protein